MSPRTWHIAVVLRFRWSSGVVDAFVRPGHFMDFVSVCGAWGDTDLPAANNPIVNPYLNRNNGGKRRAIAAHVTATLGLRTMLLAAPTRRKHLVAHTAAKHLQPRSLPIRRLRHCGLAPTVAVRTSGWVTRTRTEPRLNLNDGAA